MTHIIAAANDLCSCETRLALKERTSTEKRGAVAETTWHLSRRRKKRVVVRAGSCDLGETHKKF